MKATIATILLALLLLPFGGSYLFLGLKKSQAKKQAALAIANVENPVEIVELSFSENQLQNDLRWEHAGEFEYQGQMYDIISKEVKGDTTYFKVYWDKVETLVNQRLKELIALHLNGDDDQSDDAMLVLSLSKAIYLQPSFNSTSLFQYRKEPQFIETPIFYSYSISGIDAPPPRFRA